MSILYMTVRRSLRSIDFSVLNAKTDAPLIQYDSIPGN